jgi:hypothetical protein
MNGRSGPRSRRSDKAKSRFLVFAPSFNAQVRGTCAVGKDEGRAAPGGPAIAEDEALR